jgi:hypothetical protein
MSLDVTALLQYVKSFKLSGVTILCILENTIKIEECGKIATPLRDLK